MTKKKTSVMFLVFLGIAALTLCLITACGGNGPIGKTWNTNVSSLDEFINIAKQQGWDKRGDNYCQKNEKQAKYMVAVTSGNYANFYFHCLEESDHKTNESSSYRDIVKNYKDKPLGTYSEEPTILKYEEGANYVLLIRAGSRGSYEYKYADDKLYFHTITDTYYLSYNQDTVNSEISKAYVQGPAAKLVEALGLPPFDISGQ